MWDYITFTLDATINFIRHDGSPIALLMALAALLRVQRVQEEIEKHLPKRLRRADRLARIESKIEALMAERGILWNADSNALDGNIHRRIKTYSLTSLVTFIVQFAKRFTISNTNPRRKRSMKSKFKSRKFWMAVVTGLLIVANDGLDLGINPDTVLAFAGMVATWIIGEAAVDTARAKKEADHVPTYSDPGPAE